MKFSDVIGQHDTKNRLIKSVREDRVSHAMLFLGPEGNGALALALAFIQYLACDEPSESDSCGKCPPCLKMTKLVYPDLAFSYPIASKEKEPVCLDFIDQWRTAVLNNPYLSYRDWMEELALENKQGNIPVREARQLIQRLSLKSVEGKIKPVIIWQAEKMKAEAANALLKVLEEPPELTLFILITENYEHLISTITSRTQLIKVNRISDQELISHLQSIHQIDQLMARRIAHRADGNYNEALKLLDGDKSFIEFNERFLIWMRSCLKLNLSAISNLAQEFDKSGKEGQKNFLYHALEIARECLLINYSDRSLVRLDGKDLEDISRFAPFVNIHNAEDLIEELNKAVFHLERNANSKLLFTDLSVKVYSLLKSPA